MSKYFDGPSSTFSFGKYLRKTGNYFYVLA